MPVLSARHVEKTYGTRTLFRDVSLTIARKERVGLIGANGAGKSTLLHVLSGIELPDAGVVERRRGASIQILEQEPTLDATRTAREIVATGLAEWKVARDRHTSVSEALAAGHGDHDALLAEQAELSQRIEADGGWHRDHQVEDVLGKVGIRELDRPVGSMSGGERRRVSLAQLLVARPTLAILDEPTNHLDAETIEWLEEYFLTDYDGALLMVTHDRYVLDAICDKTIELDRGELVEYRGGYGDYLEQKAERLAHAERAEQNRLNILRRETAWLLRGAKARTTKQKARIQRAEALQKAAPAKEQDAASFQELAFGGPRLGGTVLDLVGVRVEVPGKVLVSGLDLHLVEGNRIGIVGRSGAGKSSLLRAIAGEIEVAAGKIDVGARTRVVYFDQSRQNLDPSRTVLENIMDRSGVDPTGSNVVDVGGQKMEVRTYLERFLFDGHKLRQPVSSLSGGERARVTLAKLLLSNANLLLMDEPTNDLDVTTLAALEELLVGWRGALLVVSHDRWFLDRVATSILSFEDGGKVTHYAGNYQAFRARAERARDDDAEARKATRTAPPRKAADDDEPSAAKPLSFKEQRELDGLMERIDEAEKTVAELEAKLADPGTYTDKDARDAVPAMQKSLESARASVVQLMERWEALEARRGAKK